MKQRIQAKKLRPVEMWVRSGSTQGRHQASMRTCLACKEDSASERSASEDGRPKKAPSPLSPEPNTASANASASGHVRPLRSSSFVGAGVGDLVGDDARTAQQAIPQQKPVSVPQQHFVDCSGAEMTVLPSTDTIT